MLKIFTTSSEAITAHLAEPLLNQKIKSWAKERGIKKYQILNGSVTLLPVNVMMPMVLISIFVSYEL